MPPLTASQLLAKKQLEQCLGIHPFTAIFFGEHGSGKRTVLQSLANEARYELIEAALPELGTLIGELVEGRQTPVMLNIIGVETASHSDLSLLHSLLRTKSYRGSVLDTDVCVVASYCDSSVAGVAKDHWALASAPRVRLESRRTERELLTIIDYLVDSLGATLPAQSRLELARACDARSLTQLTSLFRLVVNRTEADAVSEVLTQELGTVLGGVTYRGEVVSLQRVNDFMAQFPISMRPIIAKVLRAMFSSYYWPENRFHQEIVRLIQDSGIPLNSDVGFARWQDLGDSGEMIAGELKRAARWKNVEVDLREGARMPEELPPFLVIADDIVGSGRTVKRLLSTDGNLTKLAARFPGTRFAFLFLAAWSKGLSLVRDYVRAHGAQMSIHVRQQLLPSDSCLGDESLIVPSEPEQARLKAYCKEFSREHGVSQDFMFGYGKCALAFAFHAWVPNNSLPILWHDMSKWKPLIPRSQQVAVRTHIESLAVHH